MKKLVALITVIFLSLTGFSNSHNSYFLFKTWNNSAKKVIIDGVMYKAYSNLIIKNFTPGHHLIKVIEDNGVETGKYQSYRAKILYKGEVFIPASSNIEAYLEKNHSLSLHITPLSIEKKKKKEIIGYQTPHKRPKHKEYTYVPQIGNYYSEYHKGKVRDSNSEIMTEGKFLELLSNLKDTHFDDAKLEIALQTGEAYNYTSQQVKRVMHEFSFEKSKVLFAKQVYIYVLDKQNYFVVNQAFAYGSSKKELDTYIKNNPISYSYINKQ